MFIAIEGADGVGKTTQAAILAAEIRGTGREVLQIGFPSDSPAGRAARRLLHDSTAGEHGQSHVAVLIQSTITADRYSRVGEIIGCLRRGGIVIADRWTQSGEAYGVEDGLDLDWLTDMQFLLPRVDLNILLDLSAEEVRRRLIARGGNPDRYGDESFQRRVLVRYRNLWQMHSSLSTWLVVDAQWSAAQVSAEIRRLVQQRWQAQPDL